MKCKKFLLAFVLINFIFIIYSAEAATPQYFDNSINNTGAVKPTLFSLRWTDNIGLSGYIFSWCNNETVGNVFEDFIGFTGGTINNSCSPSNSYCLDASNGWKGYAEDIYTGYNPGNNWILNIDNSNGQPPPSMDSSTYPYMSGLGFLWTYKSFKVIPNIPFNVSFVARCRWTYSTPHIIRVYLFKGNVTPCTGGRQTGIPCSDQNGNTSKNISQLSINCGVNSNWGSWTSGNFIDIVTDNETVTLGFGVPDAWDAQSVEGEYDNVSLTLAINEYWKNDTWDNTNWDSTNEWSNVTKTINSTIGALIRWKVYANDTSNNWNASEEFSFVTTTPPEIFNCTVIDAPGTYYLVQDILNSGTSGCINITANNVSFDCQGHTIQGNDVADYGIYVYRTSATTTNVTIKNCVLTDWDTMAIYLYYAKNNMLQNLSLTSNPDDAIRMRNSDYNDLKNISVSNSLYGIYVYASNYNNLTNITVTATTVGIPFTSQSTGNQLTAIIANSNYRGLYFLGSGNNTVTNSKIQANSNAGIYISSGGYDVRNTFYNNLINNSQNVFFETGYTIYANQWNTTQQSGTRTYSPGTEIGGNYWTNPSGNGYSDTCTDVDKNGFCDNNYTLNSNGPNIDYLPLSDEYTAGWPPPQYFDNSTNNTVVGKTTLFSLRWTDNVGLSGYIFSFLNGIVDTIKTVGNKNVGTFGLDLDEKIRGSWYTCPENGTAESISAYITPYDTGDKFKFAIYKKSDNSLVGETEEVTGFSTVAQWITADFSIPKPVFENTDYYIVAIAEKAGAFAPGIASQSNNPGKGAWQTRSYNLGFPNPWNPTTDNYNFSIYLNYTPWVTDEWQSMTGVEDWSNVTKTINSTVGVLIKWRVYANDTSNNWNASEEFSFVTIAGAGTISIDLNTTTVWWGEPVNLSGIAKKTGWGPISNQKVNITFNNKAICLDISNTTIDGWYSCVFNVPFNLGINTVKVEITDPVTNQTIMNTTILEVKIWWGGKEEEMMKAANVGCYEVPELFQNPDGTIRKVMVKVCVWK